MNLVFVGFDELKLNWVGFFLHGISLNSFWITLQPQKTIYSNENFIYLQF